MIQLGTQMAAALSCWDKGTPGLYLWLSIAMKALVVGVVSMQRLDDRRLASTIHSVQNVPHKACELCGGNCRE